MVSCCQPAIRNYVLWFDLLGLQARCSEQNPHPWDFSNTSGKARIFIVFQGFPFFLSKILKTALLRPQHEAKNAFLTPQFPTGFEMYVGNCLKI